VHFTGWLDEVAPLLAALDVYVSASRTESFGLTIIEAMAAGRAVVATATEGAREIIDPEGSGSGILVAVGDHEALAASVLHLLEEKNEREHLGALANAQVRARFDLERMVEATEQVYLEATNTER
jgi:glycosyltransferase involved in cell wall biosynthesis